MLVLTRRETQAITIHCPDGTSIEVSVVAIDGGKVRLGFTAPATVNIARKERDDGRALRPQATQAVGGGATGIKDGTPHGQVVPGRRSGQTGLHIWPQSHQGDLSD
jgi:carbon storage regulator CsrA